MIINIDLEKLKEIITGKNIFIDEYIFLYLLFLNKEEEANDFFHIMAGINTFKLHKENYITTENKPYKLTEKGTQLFKEVESSINFDEFWENFPTSDGAGRITRRGKLWNGSLTAGYISCKKKYISKVKTKQQHDEIVRIIKARVASGDVRYINGIEVYINQCNWEKDAIKYDYESNTEAI